MSHRAGWLALILSATGSGLALAGGWQSGVMGQPWLGLVNAVLMACSGFGWRVPALECGRASPVFVWEQVEVVWPPVWWGCWEPVDCHSRFWFGDWRPVTDKRFAIG